MRDAAYEGLPYRRRRELHARVGVAVLASAGAADHEHAELLSLHFHLAGNFDQAWRYSMIAAERAESAYANIEASRFLRRAIDTGRRLGVDAHELVGLNERLGDVLDRSALYSDAAKAFAEARRLNTDTIIDSRLILKQARIADRAGNPPSSLRWLSRALRLLEGVSGSKAMGQRAQLSATYATVRAGQGRASDAIRWAERAITEAEAVGELEALANAHYMIAWTNVNRGELGQADHFERALALFEELGNVRRQGDVLTYYGAMAYWEGRWKEAVDLYERGRERSARAGDTEGVAIASQNIAEIRSDQGRLEEAEGPARQALRVFRSSHYPELIATAAWILGRVLSRGGGHKEASPLLEEALRMADESGGRLLQAAALGFVAEDMVRQGLAEGALEHVERAQARAAPVGGAGVYEPMLLRVRGEADLLLGELDRARDAFDEALAAARRTSNDFETLQVLRARQRIRERQGEPPSAPEEDEADTIAERLGIVSASGVAITPN
jgi:tetratricopeptide (TPR) repeat protein